MMDDIKLTIGDLEPGDHFIGFPLPGDNSGHGGYLGGHRLYTFVGKGSEGFGMAADGRGVRSAFPGRMPIIKILLG